MMEDFDFDKDFDLEDLRKKPKKHKRKEPKSLDDLIKDQLMRNIDMRKFDIIDDELSE